ncbi:MAG: xanthine dehydrogenase family protein molybdopterin-binding subunit [Alphaproteobacteria bacterium]|nr:xanthine dehydrogenase family protein molybdopterin-binding subunit [Alphaproteobacteria bacterium]
MYVGQPIRRREDVRFLTGRGLFVDDVQMTQPIAHAAFLRSPHAHAKIRSIKTERARGLPGVLTVLTGADWVRQGHGEADGVWPVNDRSGKPARTVNRPFICVDNVVRCVGEIVAMVVAEDRHQALDACEAIEVDYEPLPANVVTAKALDAGTPLVHPKFGTNEVLETYHGNKAVVDEAFKKAHHITKLEVPTNRVTASPIEPRAYMGHYDPLNDRYTVWTTHQAPHIVRQYFTRSLHIPEHKLRVVAPDVGGGFGMKLYHYPEEPLVLWGAIETERPVKWTGTRSECLMGDTHARDHYTVGEMAFDKGGKILAMRFKTLAAFGAYESQWQASITNAYHFTMLSLAYDIPGIFTQVKGVYTNCTPVDAYRGAGRPETVYQVERLIENGAKEMGIDPFELRQKNAIPPEKIPYTTAIGITYDSGDPPELFRKMKKLCNYEALREEQKKLRAQGICMGIGICGFFDMAGAGPVKMMNDLGAKIGCYDVASVRVHPSGKITVFAGSHSHGQSHATTWTQIAADRLGIPIEDIELVEGDTDRVPFGIGTWGSRSLSTAGVAVAVAAGRVIEKAKKLAAHMLECAPSDLVIENGQFIVKGTDKKIAFAEVSNAAYHSGDRPKGLEIGLEETAFYDPTDCTYPSAVHLCVVIVDPETGHVKLRNYWSVDDVGRVINPMVFEGQVHGGCTQGIGQALMEECAYDPSSGQYLSGTFMDYAIPHATDIPMFGVESHVTLTPSNPLGAKGGGESGTIAAPACISNGVIDALYHFGIRQITQPMTPKKIWRAIQDAKAGR